MQMAYLRCEAELRTYFTIEMTFLSFDGAFPFCAGMPAVRARGIPRQEQPCVVGPGKIPNFVEDGD
jgi:hypothetical protein